jgi:hypothetical protein
MAKVSIAIRASDEIPADARLVEEVLEESKDTSVQQEPPKQTVISETAQVKEAMSCSGGG